MCHLYSARIEVVHKSESGVYRQASGAGDVLPTMLPDILLRGVAGNK